MSDDRIQRIDFYILPSAANASMERFTCRLVEKAYQQGHRIFIRTMDRAQAERLDTLLWTFRQGSFLPHGLMGEAEDEPILLGDSGPTEVRYDLLINLGGDLPPRWKAFPRLAEVVDQQPELLAAARARYRHYREHGYQPHYHQLGTHHER